VPEKGIEEAEAIEVELRRLLAVADPDHPVLMRAAHAFPLTGASLDEPLEG
jgi:hypothetical protein